MEKIIGFLDGLHLMLVTALVAVSVVFRRAMRELSDLRSRTERQERNLNSVQEQIISLAGLAPSPEVEAPPEEETPDRLPPKGWMRHSEAVRLAHEYVLAVPGMRRGDAALLMVSEFLDNHPRHHNSDRGFVERIPLEAWLLKRRLPMPQRAQWRNRAIGIGVNEHGELMAYDPAANAGSGPLGVVHPKAAAQ